MVPHVKWRESQQENARLQRQIQGMEAEHRTKFSSLEGEVGELRKMKADYEALGAILDENPELAAAFEEAIRGQGQGRVQRPHKALEPALPDEVTKTIERMGKYVSAQEQRERQAAIAAADQRTSEQLDTLIGKHLGEWGYSPKFAPHARQYVLAQIRAGVLENPTLTDVPYLLSQWYEMMEDFHTTRVEAMRNGHQADAGLPATPGPTSAQVAPAPAKDAFGPLTTRRFEESLARLGWTNNGGA